MTEPAAPTPPTVEVVAMKVAEQLMSDMYRRISELEARLEAAEREADEAEREALEVDGPAVVDVAQQLLERAGALRAGTATPATEHTGAGSGADALVIHLPRLSDDPAIDHHG